MADDPATNANVVSGATKNVLMFSVDDMNAFATLKSLYPGVVHTPNIDRLMDMGTTFTNAYCPSPLCNPSRTSVLSGQMPTTTQVYDNVAVWHDMVDPSQTIFAVMKQAGYYTAGSGKLLHTTHPPAEVEQTMFDAYFAPVTSSYNVKVPSSVIFGVAPYPGNPDLLGDVQAADWATDFLGAYNSSQPFFLSYGVVKPHPLWIVPQEYFDLYPLDQLPPPPHLDGDLSDVPDFAKEWTSPELQQIVEQRGEWANALQGYFASISFADAQIGKVLDALEASGHADDTVIALWSDHGYHLGDKDAWGKFTLWDEAGRAPLIVVDPGVTTGGGVVDTTVSLVDIFPTLLDTVGLPQAPWLEGNSLMPLLENPELDWNEAAYTFVYGSWSMRTDEFRYIHYADGSEELYNMRTDPHQWNNLASNPAYADFKQALLDRALTKLAAQNWLQGTDDSAAFFDGTAAADTLVTPSEHATIRGGDGDDWYFLWNINQTVQEAINGGNDTVVVSGDYTQPLNVETMMVTEVREGAPYTLHGNAQDNTIFSYTGDDTIFGLDGDDTIDGNTGDDVLDGGNGNDRLTGDVGVDTLIGGPGDDTYVLVDAFETLVEGPNQGTDLVLTGVNHTLAPNLENLILTGTKPISGTGNELGNVMTGNDRNNTLDGAAGNDSIDGGIGSDRMLGGIGHDLYTVDNPRDLVTEAANEGIDRVKTNIDYVLPANVENLTLFGAADVRGTGNSLANTILGNRGNNTLNGAAGNDTLDGAAGNDTLDGQLGADRMIGGAGDDVYRADNVADLILENADEGTDTVISSASRTLSANVENLTLIGTGTIDGTGNGLVNILTGNDAANSLAGGDGSDRLYGKSGDDLLDGGNGNDVLVGGAGRDALTGGAGNDLFSVRSPAETPYDGALWDRIRDFVIGADKVDLSALDANTGTPANDAFTFIGEAGFSRTAGELRQFINSAGTATIVAGDMNGDGAADFGMAMTGTFALGPDDFRL